MKTKITVAILTIIIALILCGAATAEDSSHIAQNSSNQSIELYQSETGVESTNTSDTNPNPSLPDPQVWRNGVMVYSTANLQDAIDYSIDGDLIQVEPGSYAQSTVNKRVTINATGPGAIVAGFIITELSPFTGTNWVEINGFTITSTTSSGIELQNVEGCKIINNTIINNNCDGIQIFLSNGNNITGNTINGNQCQGICLDQSHSNTISGNTIQGNGGHGINLGSSGFDTNYNVISKNIITENQGNGINLFFANYNIINDTNQITFNHGEAGIYLDQSNGNTIQGNNVSNQDGANGSGHGIVLGNSGTEIDPNIITENMINGNNGDGLNIFGSNYNQIISNPQINGNQHNGINLDQSNGNTIGANIINGNHGDAGIQLLTDSNNNWILVNTISNQDGTNGAGHGIALGNCGAETEPNLMLGNIISGNNGNGIDLCDSRYTIISMNNQITGNHQNGIVIWEFTESYGNEISGNIISDQDGTNGPGNGIDISNSNSQTEPNYIMENIINNNQGNGINLFRSSFNHIEGSNQISGNHQNGIFLDQCFGTLILDNTINNQDGSNGPGHGIALENSGTDSDPNIISGNTITENTGNGINLLSSDYNLINDISAANQINNNHLNGINLDQSNNNVISGNCISNNDGNGPGQGNGIALNGPLGTGSNSNTISTNTITNNRNNGIDLYDSNSNIINGDNQINNNQNNGISLSGDNGSNGNQIIGNTISNQLGTNGPGSGIVLINSGTQINPNNISGNNINGNNGKGIELRDSNYNLINGNNQINNNQENGIYLGTFSGPGAGSGDGSGSNYNQIIGNTIQSNLQDGISLEAASHNTLSGNIINNNVGAGVILQLFLPPLNPGDPVPECSFNLINGNNVISGNTMDGIGLFSNANNNQVFENTIINNLENGIFLQGPQTGNTIHFNRIIPASYKFAIKNDNPSPVSAEYNWYGYNEQAAVEPLISGNVIFGPWMTLDINAGPPTTIPKQGTTQVTADLRTDSIGFYHNPSLPGEGAIPTTPVTFDFPLGTIPSGNTNLGQITSTLTAGTVAGTADVSATVDQETQCTPITVGISDVSVTKTDNTTNHRANVGDIITYTITLQNAGPDQATNVVVTDQLPDGLDFKSASDNGGYDPTSRKITWNLGTLDVGTKILTVNATIRTEMAGHTIAANTANETMAETPYNATGSSQSIYVPKTEVTMTKADNTTNHQSNVGEIITYTINLQNTGPDPATNVVVTDILPDGLDFIWASDNGTYNATTRTITWTLTTLNIGAKNLTFNATVNTNQAGQTITNNATETHPEYPNTSTTPNDNIYIKKAEITMTKIDNTTDKKANVGNTITYTITLQNNGPDQATNIIITDTLAEGLDFISASDSGTYNPTTQTITWTLTTLNIGAKNLTFNATVNTNQAGQTITNNATETHPEYPNTSTTPNDNIYIKKAEITMTKTDNTTNHQANVGDKVIFTITASNSALNDDATNVIIKDTVPIGLDVDLTSIIDATYNAATREITWNPMTINKGTNVIKTFQAVVNAAKAGDNAGMTNTASETHTEYPNTSTASDQVIYVPKSDLYVDGTVSNTNPYIGDIIYINFKLGNKGPDTAKNVVYTIQVPPGMAYISGDKDQGTFTYDPATRTITWYVGDVIVGDPNFKLYVQVLQAGIFKFITSLTTDTYDPNIAININIQAINAQTRPQTVSASRSAKTVGMQATGFPLGVLVVAILAILGGFWTTKRK